MCRGVGDMNEKLAILAIILLFMPLASASDYSQEYCLNSTVRHWETNIWDNVNSSWAAQLSENETCSYGCSLGKCLPAQNASNDVALVIGVGIMAFFFIYGSFKFDKNHAPMQILFLFAGIFSVIIEMGMLGDMAAQNGIGLISTAIGNGYNLVVYILVITIVYFVIWFLYEVLVRTGKINRIGDGGGE
jgi:hypothetical protein